MIESVIQLGIKGSELVETSLNNLQKKKEELSKKSDVSLGSKISGLSQKVGLGLAAPKAFESTKKQEEIKKESLKKPETKFTPFTDKKGFGVLAAKAFSEKKKQEPKKDEILKLLTVDKLIANSFEGIGEKKESEAGKGEGKTGTSKPEKKEESNYSKTVKSELQSARGQAASSIQNFNGTGLAQAGIQGIASLIPVVGVGIGQAFNYVIDAVVAFKEKMKQQAAIVADTADKYNTVYNSLKGKSFEDFIGTETVKNKKGENVKQSLRLDISKSEQAGIISAITGSMGKMTDEFRMQAGKLFTSENGKTKYDVSQSTSLAQGNFASLGTDKGFFMQQISNGFAGLPPSMKQKLTSQMFGMISPEERDEQTDYGIRSTQTAFDNLDRTQASQYLGAGQKKVGDKSNVEMALDIQRTMYNLDQKVAGGLATVITKIDRVANSNDTVSNAMLSEFKSSVTDLKNSIMSAFR